MSYVFQIAIEKSNVDQLREMAKFLSDRYETLHEGVIDMAIKCSIFEKIEVYKMSENSSDVRRLYDRILEVHKFKKENDKKTQDHKYFFLDVKMLHENNLNLFYRKAGISELNKDDFTSELKYCLGKKGEDSHNPA